jgi:FkbM family methyltransferase
MTYIDINIIRTLATPVNIFTNLNDINQADIAIFHHHYYSIFKFNKQLFYNTIELNSDEESIICENFQFVTLKNDTCISDSLRSGIIFEKFLLAFVSKLIPHNLNVLDIGSNIGVWSLTYSTFITGNIYAFEPQPKIYNCLIKNIKANNCTNIIPSNIALSNIKTEYLMNADYNTKINCGAFAIVPYGGTLQIKSEVGDNLNLLSIGFIKIDVEGHELEVIEGLKNTIIRDKPIIFIEIHSSHPQANNTFKKIIEFGYSYVLKLSHCDYLFFN